jgi:hypothetical protein
MSDFLLRKVHKSLSDLIQKEQNLIKSPVVIHFFFKTAQFTKRHDKNVLAIFFV